jgi:hypothetical protein
MMRNGAGKTTAAGQSGPTRAACAAASTWPPPSSTGPRCCSWTSRPLGWTRAAEVTCGRLAELVADGTTVLLTTQYLEEADRLADNIVVADRGRIIAKGTAIELKASLGSTGVLLLFGFAISWVTALLGLVAKSAEAAAAASLPLTVLLASPPAPSC